MKERGLTIYKLKKEKIILETSLQKLREGKNVTTETAARLYRALGFQPGDLLGYVPDEE